jgi:glycosyltransferase involved in cell wall biosynthesis
MRTLYQGCIRAIRRWVRDYQPDIVHGQGTERDCAISAVYSGAANLLTIHGNMRRLAAVAGSRPFSFAWLSARLEAWALPRTRGVVCISAHAREQVQSLARRTWLVPNAVDPGFLDTATVPVTPPQLVCVANVMPVKNQNQLIRSLDPLAKQLPFKLVFIGNANYDEPFGREFIELIRNRPWCHHRGFADRESLKAALAVSSALVLPSLEENCPMAVLEAMAAGVPVLAAQVGGLPDLIKDGATGLLFDPNNPVQIRAGVQMILSEPRLAGELARRARQEVDLRFTPEVVARRHLEIYRELLASVGTR